MTLTTALKLITLIHMQTKLTWSISWNYDQFKSSENPL